MHMISRSIAIFSPLLVNNKNYFWMLLLGFLFFFFCCNMLHLYESFISLVFGSRFFSQTSMMNLITDSKLLIIKWFCCTELNKKRRALCFEPSISREMSTIAGWSRRKKSACMSSLSLYIVHPNEWNLVAKQKTYS